MHVYPVSPGAASSVAEGGEVMVAVRLADLVTPLRKAGCRAGTAGRRWSSGGRGGSDGRAGVFCKIVAVAPAQVRRDGRVQAKGSPVHHATLGPLEEWLEEKAGPGVIGGIAERAVLREQYVKGERERLLAAAFMIRVIVLMTLMPGAGVAGRSPRWPGTWPGCRGRGRGAGVGARSGTGGTRSARNRWRNCRTSCCAPRGRSMRTGTGGRSSSAGTGR